MSFTFVNPWHLFLPRDGGHVISFMGSGGKTSLQGVVADIYASENVATVLTNTTSCEVLPNIEALHWDDLPSRLQAGLPPKFYLHRGVGDDGKWFGLAPEEVDRLGEIMPDRIVLVEVDGARKMPLKLYRDGEPVWPARTSLVLLVMGVGAVGSKVGEVVHRWGSRSLPGLESMHQDAVLEWRHLELLLTAQGGYLDHSPAEVPIVMALTGIEGQDDTIGLFEFVGGAMGNTRLPLVVFCTRNLDGEKSDDEPQAISWEFRTAAAADRDEQP